jgi:hypothetical protein
MLELEAVILTYLYKKLCPATENYKAAWLELHVKAWVAL